MTTWTVENTYRARVFDVERNCKVSFVVAADDVAGVLTVHTNPPRVLGDEIEKHLIQCRSIVPIFGGEAWPQLILCFGVQS